MRYYELLYIINPNFEDERVKGIIEEIGNEVQKHDVNVINHHIWGKKRLAYAVKNNKYGIYILLQFGAEKFEFLKEFERYLILNKSVIRHQIVRLEDEPRKVENIEAVVDETEESDEEVFDIPNEGSDDEIDDKENEESEVVESEESVETEKTEETGKGEETKEEGE
jgi:small subunit ribosomal protein S6